MAGQIVYGKGTAPSAPSSGNNAVFVEGTSASSNIGIVKSLDASGVLSILSPNNRPNLLRNAGFWFAQRQAFTAATTYSATAGRAISADGWGITNENASATYRSIDTQSATEAGLQNRYYGEFLKITSTGKLVVSQVIEANDSEAVRGRVVRVTLWMKATAATNVRLGLIQLNSAGTGDTVPATYISAFGGTGTDPTLGANLAYIAPKATVQPDNGTVNGNAVDCVLSTAWQRFSHVFDVPASSKNLIVSVWSNAQLTATNGFFLAQASLTDGYEIQDWTPLSTADEFLKCQRFYASTFANTSTAPATAVGLNTGECRGIAGKAGALAQFIPVRFPVKMRITPATITLFNPAAANAQVRDVTAGGDMTVSVANGSTALDFFVGATGNAATAVGNLIAVHYTADAEL